MQRHSTNVRGYASVELNEKWGVVDKTGKEVIPVRYDAVKNSLASEQDNMRTRFDLFAVQLDGKWGFANKDGKEIIPLQYDEVSIYMKDIFTDGIPIYDERAEVRKDDCKYVIASEYLGKPVESIVDPKDGVEYYTYYTE